MELSATLTRWGGATSHPVSRHIRLHVVEAFVRRSLRQQWFNLFSSLHLFLQQLENGVIVIAKADLQGSPLIFMILNARINTSGGGSNKEGRLFRDIYMDWREVHVNVIHSIYTTNLYLSGNKCNSCDKYMNYINAIYYSLNQTGNT